MGNIKRGEISKTQLIAKWESIKGRKAPSSIQNALKEDIKREVEYLISKQRQRADYRKMLREKGESK